MIGYIRGTVTAIFEDSCFIEAGGIGYRVYISEKDRDALSLQQEERLITYLAVREDALTLYGFLSQEAYDLFLLLLSVSKIGPKVAMGVLSAVRPAEFGLAVRNKDLGVLTKLPGIGKKTAERLLLELKDKIGSFAGEDTAGIAPSVSAASGAAAEAVAALCSLGYRPAEVEPVVQSLAVAIDDTASLIGAALRELGRMRT